MQHPLIPPFIYKITNWGVQDEMPFTEKRNIRISNIVSLAIIFSSVFYHIPLFFVEGYELLTNIIANITAILGGVSVLWLNYRCKPLRARIFMLIFFTTYVLTIPWLFQQFAGEIIYLFAVLVASVLLFDKRRLIKTAFFCVCIALIAHILLYTSPAAILPYRFSPYFFMITAPIGIWVLYIILMLFKQESEVYQQQIEQKNEELYLQKLEIGEQNHELQAQQISITQQNIILEYKNKQILDSINYASRIQKAILPLLSNIEKVLPKHFVFYLPKDIVSGDFYWFEYLPEQQISVLAVADCTGHGVSGCLMSMIGANILNQIVDELKIYEPDKILNELDRKVRYLLKQDGEKQAINDGMDIALCVLQPQTTHLQLGFAGAKRPLILIQNGELIECKGDKNPIGSNFYEEKSFTAHSFRLLQGHTFYIFSDGITDQFDANNTKKFTTKRFKELLLQLQTLPFDQHLATMQDNFIKWKGYTTQTDDVLVLGVHV